MPFYEYKCRACGHQFEKLILKASDTPVCESCQSAELERLLSLPAISTDKSRKRTMGIARKAAQSVKKEKDHAQREYERNYIKDHS